MSDFYDFCDARMERLRDYVPARYLASQEAQEEIRRVAAQEARKRGLSPMDDEAGETVPVKPRNLPGPLTP